MRRLFLIPLLCASTVAAQSGSDEDIVAKLTSDLLALKLAVASDEPLKDDPYSCTETQSRETYALEEIARCSTNPHLRNGLKLHFGNSDVDVDNAQQLAQLRRVFRAANANHMTIAVHMHANVDHHRPYGAREARVFLEQLLPEAPDVAVQIAHLAGSGAFDDATNAALAVFAEAIERGDPWVRRVWFDACGIVIPGRWETKADLIAKRMRQIGVNRILCGSDPGEFRTIERNVAPWVTEAN